MSFLISSPDKTNVLMLANIVDMKMFSLQLAAYIIDTLNTMPISGRPGQGAGQILEQYVHWADNGYCNAVQTTVSFLYNTIPVFSEAKYLFEKQELDLIKDALNQYQKFKTRVVKENQKLHGSDFGSKTEFALKDWTDPKQINLITPPCRGVFLYSIYTCHCEEIIRRDESQF